MLKFLPRLLPSLVKMSIVAGYGKRLPLTFVCSCVTHIWYSLPLMWQKCVTKQLTQVPFKQKEVEPKEIIAIFFILKVVHTKADRTFDIIQDIYSSKRQTVWDLARNHSWFKFNSSLFSDLFINLIYGECRPGSPWVLET